MKHKKIFLFFLVFILLLGGLLFSYYQEKQRKEEVRLKDEKRRQEKQKIEEKMKANFHDSVKVTDVIDLYKKDNKQYQKVGTLKKGISLFLTPSNFDSSNPYFSIQDTPYYISYRNIVKNEELVSNRYQDYIPFPIRITTKVNATFYKEDGKALLQLEEPVSLEVVEKKDDRYGVSFLGQLLFVKKMDIEKEEGLEETKEVASTIPVLNYHFIYLNGDTSCNESICHSEEQIKSHFSYLKENKVLTITPGELEKFIDDEIRLPKKTILLTIDDGARAEKFIPFLEEYQLQATLFLVSSWYPKETFSSSYLTIASHTHDMHTTGVCPQGQGGGIRCLDEEMIQKDLKQSREILNQTTAFCYPFYEYNDYAIEQLKKAGFTIAFIGGSRKVDHNTNKFMVPRYPVQSYHDVSFIKQLVEG